MSDNNNPNQSSGENAPKTETTGKGKEAGQKALESVQKALGHAVNAIKTIVTDPMNGQFKALTELGETNAFSAGIVFIAIFLIAALIASLGYFRSFIYWGGGLGFFGYVKLLISSLVPIVGLFVGYLLIDKALGKKDTNWMVYVFTTGVTVLPIVILFLLFWFPFQAITAIGVFCMSLTVLIVYSALSSIYKLSTKAAFWLTPVLFLVVALVSRVFYSMIF